MVSIDAFRAMALDLPGAEENPHFDRTAFKVTGKRIFASLHTPGRSANIKLSPTDQNVFCTYEKGVYAVPNKFGLQGWTTFELDTVPAELVADALRTAYADVMAPKPKKK